MKDNLTMEIKTTDTLIGRRYKERYNSLPRDKKEKINLLEENSINEDYYQLKVIKRKRKIFPKIGDVFMINPKENLYFYGVVINTEFKDKRELYKGIERYVVMIFRKPTKEINGKDFEMDFDNLLIPPEIVSKNYWTRGYFYNIDMTVEIPKDLDYGFYTYRYIDNEDGQIIGIEDVFMDECRNILDREPKLLGIFGISTRIGVAMAVSRELIIDDSLNI